ncbi:MAG: VCBS domain-containing protein, partial [Methylomonas sp.]
MARNLWLGKSFAKRDSANLNWQYLEGAVIVVAGLSDQLAVDNVKHFNLITDDAFNHWLTNTLNLASKSNQKKLLPTGDSVNDSGLIELLKLLFDSLHFESSHAEQTNSLNLKLSDFNVVSVLSMTELDEAASAVVLANIPTVNQFVDVYRFATEPIVLVVVPVNSRLDLSDIGFFSAVQDFHPYLSLSGPVVVSVGEGGQLVFANALANAYGSSRSLSVVGVPELLPIGIRYDATHFSFSFNPSDPAYNPLASGQVLNVSVVYTVSDGRINLDTAVIFQVMGTNDVASISGISTAAITETDAMLNASGTLSVADLDAGEAGFVPQTQVAGDHGFGLFSIDADGHWTYSAGAHNEFVAGVDYTDSITVASVDGTAVRVITVTITGSNDAAPISGTSTASITESDAGLNASGTLSVADLDAGEAGLVAQTQVAGDHGFGLFS